MSRAPDRADFAIALPLAAAALVTRRHTLPRDGLWHDDAWVAVGATHGSIRHLLTLGYGEPGFSLVLRAFGVFVGGSSEQLVYPVFVVGILTPAVLYLAARRLQYARSICALLAAPVIGLSIAVAYSGHIKTYVIDVLIVLSLIMVVPRLVSAPLRRRTIVLGSVASVAICSFSVFALVATITAIVFAALQARTYRAVRVVTAAAFVVAAAVYLEAVQSTYNDGSLHEYWRSRWDGYVGFSANPVRLVKDIAAHIARIGYVYPGGHGLIAGAAATTAVAGIGICAIRCRYLEQRLRARYAGLLLLVALAASIAGKFVFGPKPTEGLRVALWLLPVVALGLAIALQQLREMLARRTRTLTLFDTTAYTAALVVMFIGVRSAPDYQFSGARSATHYIESHVQGTDSVLILGEGIFNYAAVSRRSFSLKATPRRTIGFVPVFRDARIFNLPYFPINRDRITGAQRDVIRMAVRPSARVFVYVASIATVPRFLDHYLRAYLMLNGFIETPHLFNSSHVYVWELIR